MPREAVRNEDAVRAVGGPPTIRSRHPKTGPLCTRRRRPAPERARVVKETLRPLQSGHERRPS